MNNLSIPHNSFMSPSSSPFAGKKSRKSFESHSDSKNTSPTTLFDLCCISTKKIINYFKNTKIQPKNGGVESLQQNISASNGETKLLTRKVILLPDELKNNIKIDKQNSNVSGAPKEQNMDSNENRIYSRNVIKSQEKTTQQSKKTTELELNNKKKSNKNIVDQQISSYIRQSEYSNLSRSIGSHRYSQKKVAGNNTPGNNSKNSIGKPKSEAESIDVVYDITTYIRCLFHDFRGPLNNISMGIDVLSQMISNINNPDIAECTDMINNIHNSCEFMSSTLDGFLNLSQISNMNDVKKIELTYTPFNIIGLIKKVQYLLMFNILEKKITIENKMSVDLEEWVLGDATHLQHVFYNILSNAVKFSKKNSKITINLETKKLLGNTQKLSISFMDENEPIPANIKENIFTSYNTSDTKSGTGLGLYICKKIIDLHDGKIYHEFTTTNNNKFIIEMTLMICNNSKNNICLSNDSSLKNPSHVNSQSSLLDYAISFEGKKKLEQESNVESVIVSKKNFDDTSIAKQTSGMKIGIKGGVVGDFISCRENNEERRTKLFVEKDGEAGSSTDFNLSNESNIELTLDSQKVSISSKIKIALVDDSDISRKLLNRLLGSHSFIKENKCKIYESVDGLDAISMLHNKINKFSIIFMDNIMPSISGVLASKILRGFGYKNLIFGITGNGLTEDVNEFIVNGADYVFVKPFKKENLDMVFVFVATYGFSVLPGKKIVMSEDKTKFMLVDC